MLTAPSMWTPPVSLAKSVENGQISCLPKVITVSCLRMRAWLLQVAAPLTVGPSSFSGLSKTERERAVMKAQFSGWGVLPSLQTVADHHSIGGCLPLQDGVSAFLSLQEWQGCQKQYHSV